MPVLNWNALYDFWLVAEYGSFAAASRQRPWGSAQALHKRVRELEKKENLDLKLLRSRGVRGVELTEAGRQICRLVDPVFRSFDLVASELRGEASGTLTVALTRYASDNYGTELMSGVKALLPSFSAAFFERPLLDVHALVEAGKVDLAIASPPEHESHDLEVFAKIPMSIELLAPASHPLARDRRQRKWRQVLEYPMILLDRGTLIRKAFDHVVQRTQLTGRLRVAAEVSTVELAVSGVRAGLGIALVPVGPRRAKELEDVARLQPPSGLATVNLAVMHNRSRYVPKYVRTILEFCAEMVRAEPGRGNDPQELKRFASVAQFHGI